MAEELPVEAQEDVPISVGGDGSISVREAGRLLSSYRWNKPAEEREPDPTPVDLATPAESGEQPEAAPETEPGQVEAATPEPEELPPIEAPRSWSRDWKEEFQTYPREIQEKISAREQERETALRRGQNEAAEQRKAANAERAQMEQARQQYEALLPQILQTLTNSQLGEFADIKTPQDLERLAREDWPRYALFDAKQKQVQAVQQEMRASQERANQEYQSKWSQFAKDEDAKFIELNPEMANTETAGKLREASVTYLQNIGLSEEDLGKLWNGQNSLSLRDHRVQRMILDAVRYREAKAAVPKAAVKPVPKVQRPGSPAQRVPDADAQEKALYQRIEETRGLAAARLGAQLISQRRNAR